MEKILFEYEDYNGQYAIESAWASRIGENYQLENILFYAFNYSFRDILEVENREGELYVVNLVRGSGRSTVRVIFYSKEDIPSTLKDLVKMGCDYEVSDLSTLVSVDVPPDIKYDIVKAYLEKGEQRDKWSYEEACLAH